MKRLKKILPLFCAALLVLGSSMTVFASSYSFPDCFESLGYDLVFDIDGINYYFTSNRVFSVSKCTHTTYGYVYQFISTSNGGSFKVFNDSECVNSFNCSASSGMSFLTMDGVPLCIDSDSWSLLYSSYDIYFTDSEELFFQAPPAPTVLEKSMGELQTQVTTSQQAITMTAILLLACLIGSVTLLPRLLHSLAK